MGKIVKYCSSCEEGFAKKFSFCPNCASELSTFEMQPVAKNEKVNEVIETAMEEPTPQTPPKHPTPKAKTPIVPDIQASVPTEPVVEESVFEPVDLLAGSHDEAPAEFSEIEIELPEEETVEFQPAETMPADGNGYSENPVDVGKAVEAEEEEMAAAFSASEPKPIAAESYAEPSEDYHPARGGDDNYSVTVISERNTGIRNGLLMGSFALIIVGFFSVMVFSLFNNLDEIPALNQDPNLIAYLNDTPMQVEEDIKDERKDDKKSGGGGGGGKDEPKPVSKGERPPMMESPRIAPSSKMDRVTKPDIPIQAGFEGPTTETTRTSERYGDKNSLNTDSSDGSGSGGGMGTGRGRGVGSGNGTGFGSGDGSGMGSGSGDGIGDGTGSGNRDRRATPRRTPRPSGPSTPMSILSKPRPGYTEAARKANLTGTVRLRVTFNANGSIGSITPITRLGSGLTEKAIAAARSIRFKPEMRNGRPVGVKKTIAYNFSIY